MFFTSISLGCLPIHFHFFGGLWLEDPSDHLSSEELVYLQDLLPLIRNLESSNHRPLPIDIEFLKEITRPRANCYEIASQSATPTPNWDINQSFQQLVVDETQWWRSRGVERPPQFLVKPDGSLNARVACHLYNPTFCVADPSTPTIWDNSNPSISQIQRAGFTPENSFFFDHFPRREESQHVDDCYPEELCDIYNLFISAL